MKKVLALVLVMCMALTFVACGGGSELEKEVAAYKRSDDYKTVVESLEGSGLDVDMYAKGDDLVVTYTFTESFDATTEALLKETLQAQLPGLMSAFDGAKADLPSMDEVIVEIYTSGGKLLASSAR